MFFVGGIIVISLIMLFLVSHRYHNGATHNINYRNLQSNDNERFKNMLLRKGEIELCDRIKIDMSTWAAIIPTVSKITGIGENSLIEIYPNAGGEISLFNMLKNIEISNIHVNVNPPSTGANIFLTKGIVNEIVNSTINGFHITITSSTNYEVLQRRSGFFSNTIKSSVLNDVGISFPTITIKFKDSSDNQTFSLISNSVESDNRITYNGIYIKGKSITVETAKAGLHNGIMFGNISNIDFNYVVLDLESIRFDVRSEIYYGLFAYSTLTETALNNVLIIVRNSFRYEDYDGIDTDSFFSMISIYMNKKMTINHCLIDVRFSDMIINYLDADLWGNDKIERILEVSGVVYNADDSLQLVTNYLQVRFYLEKNCKYNSKVCTIATKTCKAICKPILFATVYKTGNINIKNSYFYLEKASDKKVEVEPYFISTLSAGIIIDSSYLTKNVDKFEDKSQPNIIEGNVDTIYPTMASIGYSKNGSIIYDSSLPYYDFNSNRINYEIFQNVTPEYENVCDITNIDSTITPGITTTPSDLENTTSTEKATSTEKETTTPSSTTTTITTPEEHITTTVDVEITEEEQQSNQSNQSNESNKNDSQALLISLSTVGSVIGVGGISGMIFFFYKRKLCQTKKVSPESSIV